MLPQKPKVEIIQLFIQVGKIDEIFGTLREFFVSVKLSDEVKAQSFKKGQQVLHRLSSMSFIDFIESQPRAFNLLRVLSLRSRRA